MTLIGFTYITESQRTNENASYKCTYYSVVPASIDKSHITLYILTVNKNARHVLIWSYRHTPIIFSIIKRGLAFDYADKNKRLDAYYLIFCDVL